LRNQDGLYGKDHYERLCQAEFRVAIHLFFLSRTVLAGCALKRKETVSPGSPNIVADFQGIWRQGASKIRSHELGS
jgi:hypothetical protein